MKMKMKIKMDRTVKGDLALGEGLRTNTIRCHYGHHASRTVAYHGALPVLSGVISGVFRLRADGRGVKEDLRTLQAHGASSLGEPLVPADSHADLRELGVEYLESGVSRSKVELLLVSRSIRNVRFSVQAKVGAISVNNSDGIEECVISSLKEADW